MDEAVKKFFVQQMMVPVRTAQDVILDTVRPADEARNSKIQSEYVVMFANVESRDAIKSYASGLAAAKGAAGLRLDVPPCLKGSFKILNEYRIAMIRIYGKEVKHNIHFDDRNEDLMMDIKLPTSATWHNTTIDQAREAKKARDTIDIRSIRQTALGGYPSQASGTEQDKARALMLAINPSRGPSTSANFQSASGVVHINSSRDWTNFEAEEEEVTGDSSNRSVEEILGTRSTRNGGRRKTNTQD